MKFGNSFLKLNYSIMAFILAFQTSQCNVRAMENDPTANNKKLWDMVKREFKNNDKDQDGSIRMLTFPKDKAKGEFANFRFVFPNGQEFGKGDYINPELEDHRAMKFFNMPAFLQKMTSLGSLLVIWH